jgi:hypothetical protein
VKRSARELRNIPNADLPVDYQEIRDVSKVIDEIKICDLEEGNVSINLRTLGISGMEHGSKLQECGEVDAHK